MKINRHVLITAIIKHQDSFFKLLDYIDSHDGSLEFPEYLYINLYNNEICQLTDDQNIPYQLSLASLMENGIFIYNNKNTGMITVEQIIIDLLRFIDVKRIKELTQADFEHLRKRCIDSVNDIQSLNVQSEEYQDSLSVFNGLMSEIHSKIKENVNGLNHQTESIAKDYMLYETPESDLNVVELYNKVNTVYRRYVLPCYEFINPTMDMIQTQSFSKSVQLLIDYHVERDLFTIANAIQFRKTAISSYYKDIYAIAKKLEQFSIHLQQERNYFLAIESAHSELMDDIKLLRHGKQKNKYLNTQSSFFSSMTMLDGISDRKSRYAIKLNCNRATAELRFKEYLLLIEENESPDKVVSDLKPLSLPVTIDQIRQITISKLLYKTEIPENIPDLHQFIYNLLSDQLKDFSLVDVLYGLEYLISTLNSKLFSKPEKMCLTDEKYYFYYIRLTCTSEQVNSHV